MGILDNPVSKERLLGVELPALQAYNSQRDPEYRVSVEPKGGELQLRYRLKPAHNVYELVTVLPDSYPVIAPTTRVLTKLESCPHLLYQQTLCLWKQASRVADSRWDPARFTAVFAIQAAWRWLACYEIWVVEKTWPIPEAR
ncbi:MAG: hypothetical protein ACKO9Z_14175 [Planctomycetota bacterium]|jgi:hypothetical protein